MKFLNPNIDVQPRASLVKIKKLKQTIFQLTTAMTKKTNQSKAGTAGSAKVDSDKKEQSKSIMKKSGPPPTFRVIIGSYEHTLLCLSLMLYPEGEVFTPIFYFTPHTQSIRCLAQSKRYLASGGNDEHIRLYDLQKRKELGTLLHHNGSVVVLKFFESKWLLSGAADGKICIWRTKDWDVLAELKGHQGTVNDISIHPSGKLALSVSDDKTLRLWNLMTAKKASVLKLGEAALKVTWTDDGEHYILGFDKRILLYKAENVKQLRELTFKSPLQHMEIVSFEDDKGESSSWLVSSHNDGKIIFRSLSDIVTGNPGDEIETFELVAHAVRVKHFSFLESSGIPYLCSVSSDGRTVIWDLRVRTEVAVYKSNDRLNCCLLVPDDVEQYETVKRTIEDRDPLSDYSEAESDTESVVVRKKKSKKRSKVSVELS